MPAPIGSGTREMPLLPIVTAFYRILLVALPREMRRAHGDAIVQTFRDLCRHEYARGGILSLLAVGRRAVHQVLAAGVAERWGKRGTAGHSLRRVRQNYRSRRPRHMSHVTQDLRFALRGFRRKPAFALTAVAIIALAIGATTTIFSVVDGVVLRALPVPNPASLVYFDNASHTGPDFRAWRERVTALDQIAAVWPSQMDLLGDGNPARINGARVTPSFFAMMGARPFRGRLLTATDVQVDSRVAMLTHRFWVSRYGADETVIGRSIQLDGESYEIVGVLNPDFEPARRVVRLAIDVYTPLNFTSEDLQRLGFHVLSVVGRLAPGNHIETAQAQVDASILELDRRYPGHYRDPGGEIWREVPLVPLHEAEVGEVQGPLLLLLGAVGFMLLIACANVANLFLARGADRQREIAVRSALGAGRVRIAVQLLTESVLVAAFGGIVGVGLALLGVRLFARLGPDTIPRLDQVSVDYRVLAFVAAVSVLTGIAFGLAPAFYAARTDVNAALKDTASRASATRGHMRIKSLLVVAEIAMALVLLVGAGLLFNSFIRLTRVDTGFVPDRVLMVPLDLGRAYETDEGRLQFTRDVVDRLLAIGSFTSVAGGMATPFSMGGRCCWMSQAKSTADDSIRVVMHPVTPGYFDALGVSLVQGRDFDWSDDDTSPAPAIITRALADRFFPDGNALGGTVTVGRSSPTPFRVIGIVNDFMFWSVSEDEDVDLFLPYAGFGPQFEILSFVVRVAGSTEGLADLIRQTIWSVNGRLPVPRILSLPTQVGESIATPRFMAALLIVFAAIAITLAAGGVYATMLYAVSQRSHELGVRMALGATAGQLLRHVLGGGARLAAIGLVIGLAGALALSRLLNALVFGISVQDVPTYAVVTVLLAIVALAACYLPARWAARADPMSTLRGE